MQEKQFYPSGELELLVFRNENGQWDRTDGPAVTKYNKDGTIQFELFYRNGKCHCSDKAAFVTYGTDRISEGYFQNDKLQTHILRGCWIMKTKIEVRSFIVLEHLDESVDEQIERNINEQLGKFVQATEERLVGGRIRVRAYFEVPDNTEENKQ